MAATTTGPSPYTGQLVYAMGVQVLFNQAHGAQLTPRCKQRIREAGIDLEGKLLPAYPRTAYLAAKVILAEEVYAGSGPESFRAMGQRFFGSYLETGTGKASGVVIRLLGPRRTLARTGHFRQSDNFTTVRAAEVDPACTDLIQQGVGPYPQFLQGVYLEVVRTCGGEAPEVEIRDFDGVDACTFRVRWQAR